MRLTGLLAILLFLAIVFFAAPAASYAQSMDSASAPSAFADAGKTGAILPPPRIARRMITEERRDGVCFTMRTYIVARESRDSDVTHPKAYRECLPEWKLQMRSTDSPSLDQVSR